MNLRDILYIFLSTIARPIYPIKLVDFRCFCISFQISFLNASSLGSLHSITPVSQASP